MFGIEQATRTHVRVAWVVPIFYYALEVWQVELSTGLIISSSLQFRERRWKEPLRSDRIPSWRFPVLKS